MATHHNQITCSQECHRKRNNKLSSRKAKAERMEEARMAERGKEMDYGTANMNAIAEIARQGVHYGQIVAEKEHGKKM